MSIYAIGDLHLSGEPPSKPMTVFGPQWENHWSKVQTDWRQKVTDDDAVIICGDISWAMQLQEALQDLAGLIALPGRKILLRGNHDYWWSTVSKITQATNNKLDFLQNNFYAHDGVGICGTRGWNLPTMEGFTDADMTIYKRELLRLESSLQQARAQGLSKLIVALHYPPFYGPEATSGFSELCEQYQVAECVYGHVHGEAAHALGIFQGDYHGTNYRLVAADYVDFRLQKII